MSQSAPLQWFACSLIFTLILWSVISNTWYYPLRPRFLFSAPSIPNINKWLWINN